VVSMLSFPRKRYKFNFASVLNRLRIGDISIADDQVCIFKIIADNWFALCGAYDDGGGDAQATKAQRLGLSHRRA
jgi:hypothetical protein